MLQVIGVDVGNGFTKTRNSILPSGVLNLPGRPPLSTRVIEFENEFYSVGNHKIAIQKSRTEDESMRLLTMAGIAEELKRTGKTVADVRLGVGTPLTRMGAEKDSYLSYYNTNRRLIFKYEDVQYTVNLLSVDVFPQGYSGMVSRLGDLKKSALIIDIGSGTVDIMPINEQIPDVANCKSLQMGVITCINDIQEALRQTVGQEADFITLRDVMINGTGDIPEEYLSVIQKGCSKYITSLIDQIRALHFNSDLTQFIFMGGGASLAKHFILDIKNVLIFDDIHLNASGYETLIHHKYKD